VWGSRFRRIIETWAEIESMAVLLGIRRCALITTASQARVSSLIESGSNSVAALPLHEKVATADADSHLTTDSPQLANAEVVIGQPRDVRRFVDAWTSEDEDEIGRLLGYPTCCINAFRERCLEQQWDDPTWAIAVATASVNGLNTTIDIDAPIVANVLWRSIGIRAIPHLPCRFTCEETVSLGERFLAAAEASGFGQEANWLKQILSWPVEWSSLHGIAELKTPILKACTQTDAIAEKHSLHWLGSAYPEEGATGTRFPYRTPGTAQVTDSRSFKRGLEQRTDKLRIL
jgi:hypothetical protein